MENSELSPHWRDETVEVMPVLLRRLKALQQEMIESQQNTNSFASLKDEHFSAGETRPSLAQVLFVFVLKINLV